MNANDWYKPSRELSPEEMLSPWIVTDINEITEEKVSGFLAASGKSCSAYKDVSEMVKAIKSAWHGHLLDWFVPKKNGAVLLDHLVAFAVKCEGSIKCYQALAPTAQPNCYLSRIGNTPVIVYGSRYLTLKNDKWTVNNDIDTVSLKPMADFALKKRFPAVADAYVAAIKKLSDLRVVVAIDKDFYDKDMGIVERLDSAYLRPVLISVGNHTAAQRQKVDEISQYREIYVCEEPSLIPVCIGKTRSLFISDNSDLCEKLAFCGVKVVAAGVSCPGAALEVPKGQEKDITSELILRQFVRAERTLG
jgi:hypothetical protein